MPWLETDAVKERMRFIVAWEQAEDGDTFAGLCRSFGISRQKGYKWLRRFEEGGPAALEDRPPLARRHGNETPEHVADLVAALRKKHPTWGPKKLKAKLEGDHQDLDVPAASTIGDILNRRGLIAPRKRRLRIPPATVATSEYTGPNSVWCIDHKGHFALAGGGRCGPLTLLDGHSRYLLRCEPVMTSTDAETRHHVEGAMREAGLPLAMRSDGGTPFASAHTPGRLSRFAVWLIKLGLELHRNEPGHPEQNGRLERFHRTLEEVLVGGPYTREVLQRRFDAFRRLYNHERPHEALGQKTPASVYETSWRPFPAVLRSPEYPVARQTRRVGGSGRVKWRGNLVNVGKVLAGEPVYFQEFEDARWDVFFGRHFLVTVDLCSGALRTSHQVPDDPERRPPSVRRP